MDDAAIASNPVEDSNLASPTFEEAYSKATESKTDSSTLPSSKAETKPVEGEIQLDTEADAKQTPDQEEPKDTPLNEFDPEKLPEELKPLYKNLMKGFTQGRQKDREELNALKKELESLKQPQSAKPERELTDQEKIDQMIEEKITQKETAKFREQALKDYNTLDERLTKPEEGEENPKYDKIMDSVIGAQLDELLQQHIEAGNKESSFDYKTHATDLIKEWDSYIHRQIDVFTQKQRELAKKAERSFEKTNPKTASTNTKPSGAMSLEQAVSAAYRKHQA